MRAAPAVDYPLSPGVFWRCVSAALGAAVMAVPTFWALSLAGGEWPPAQTMGMLSSLSVAALGGWLGWRLASGAGGSLRWDGGRWLRLPAGHGLPEPGTPLLALDWGDWMLLRWYPTTGGPLHAGACLALSRSDRPASWHGLRVALRQPRGPAGMRSRATDGAESGQP